MAMQRTPRRAITDDDEAADDDNYAWSQLHEAVVVEDLDKLIKILRKKPQCVDTPTSVCLLLFLHSSPSSSLSFLFFFLFFFLLTECRFFFSS